MLNCKNFLMSAALCSSCMVSYNTFAAEWGVLVPGLSYHIGADASHPAYTEAPRALDASGAFVLNPGIGIVYDHRNKDHKNGLSATAMVLTFRDCDDRSVFTAGAGGRYRHFLSNNFSMDGDLYLSLYVAQDWSTSQYNTSIVPFPSVGLNYHFDNVNIGLKTTFSPRNDSHSSTSGFHILFNYLYISWSL